MNGPDRRPHNAPFLDAAAGGALLLQRCPRCGHLPSFPRVACPRCFGELEWIEASGRGTVRTYTVVRRTHDQRYAEHVPIVMALVALDEGVEMISTIVGKDRLATAIGARVELAGGERWSVLPQFRLARGPGE